MNMKQSKNKFVVRYHCVGDNTVNRDSYLISNKIWINIVHLLLFNKTLYSPLGLYYCAFTILLKQWHYTIIGRSDVLTISFKIIFYQLNTCYCERNKIWNHMMYYGIQRFLNDQWMPYTIKISILIIYKY